MRSSVESMQRIAARSPGVGEVHVEHGEQIAHAKHEKRRGIKDTLAVRQFRVVKIVPVQGLLTHGLVPSVMA